MLVTCPHCQAYTEIEPGEPGLITCRTCKRDFSPGHDPLFDDESEDITAIGPTRNRSVLPTVKGDPFSQTSPPPSVDFTKLTGDNFEALRSFGESAAVDFDEMTRQSDVGDLSLLMAPDTRTDDEESTIAVPAEVASTLAAQLREPAPPPAAPLIWRVRSARGLVYELMSLDAVVAWLEGKTDTSGVRIARGQGEFQSISSHPELAERFGGRTKAPVEAGLSDLPLTLDDRPPMTSAPPQKLAEVSPLRTDPAQSDGPQRAQRPDDPQNPIGFLGVLGVAIFCAVLIGGVVSFGVRSGWLDEMLPPAPPPAEKAAAPELQAAIASFEENNLTAAVAALQKQARTAQDPRVFRYLAMALHRQKRHQEAREALARYQQAVDPN